MPFFSSLTHTGTRVGGQREHRSQSFEAAMAHYPQDYPFTPAYDIHVQEREVEEKTRWERRPKAKRSNWTKLGTRSPWRADWEVVLGLETSTEAQETLVVTQREDSVADDAGDRERRCQTWLLCGPETRSVLLSCATLSHPNKALLSKVNQLRAKRHQPLLPKTLSAENFWEGGLVRVRLVFIRRGSPGDLAAIHRMGDQEAKTWKAVVATANVGSDFQLSSGKSSTDSIIGYVTTGHFSLCRGEGFCIGAITLFHFSELARQAQRFAGRPIYMIYLLMS